MSLAESHLQLMLARAALLGRIYSIGITRTTCDRIGQVHLLNRASSESSAAARQFHHECGKSAWSRCAITNRTDLNNTPPRTCPRDYWLKCGSLNDDQTTMEFVVQVLEAVFGKDRETATRIMLEAHSEGFGVCGIYPYDIAEAKVTEVLSFARRHGHPLQCVLERSSSTVRNGE
jgi:ATP-dependent Clp protease adapter protein ClpS